MPKRVEIRWRDVTPITGTWIRRKNLRPDTRQIITVGWLVYQDKFSLILAQDYDPGEKNCSGCSCYPRGMVDKMITI